MILPEPATRSREDPIGIRKQQIPPAVVHRGAHLMAATHLRHRRPVLQTLQHNLQSLRGRKRSALFLFIGPPWVNGSSLPPTSRTVNFKSLSMSHFADTFQYDPLPPPPPLYHSFPGYLQQSGPVRRLSAKWMIFHPSVVSNN